MYPASPAGGHSLSFKSTGGSFMSVFQCLGAGRKGPGVGVVS